MGGRNDGDMFVGQRPFPRGVLQAVAVVAVEIDVDFDQRAIGGLGEDGEVSFELSEIRHGLRG